MARGNSAMNHATDSHADRRWIFIAVLAIFVIKLVFVLLIVPHFRERVGLFYGIGTADNYDTIARNIRLGYGYRFAPDTGLTLLREPGYPLFLAALDYAFG